VQEHVLAIDSARVRVGPALISWLYFLLTTVHVWSRNCFCADSSPKIFFYSLCSKPTRFWFIFITQIKIFLMKS